MLTEQEFRKGVLLSRLKLPLSVKIEMTLHRIRQWYEHYNGNVYVSFSGGKDSTVLLHLARSLYPDIPAVFLDTGLEWPEIRKFVKTITNVIWLKSKMPFHKVIEKYGYPVISKNVAQMIDEIRNTKSEKLKNLRLTGIDAKGNKRPWSKLPKKYKYLIDAPFKISSKCCDVLKKNPAKQYERETGRKPIIGSMASESGLREKSYLKYGCNAFDKNRPISNAIIFWTEQDVLESIYKSKIPYAIDIYGDIVFSLDQKYELLGEERTGCMFCCFGLQFENPNKFQKMKCIHPKLWDYCINKLDLRKVLDFINCPYE